jgi:hypothetical protein
LSLTKNYSTPNPGAELSATHPEVAPGSLHQNEQREISQQLWVEISEFGVSARATARFASPPSKQAALPVNLLPAFVNVPSLLI